jgi:hypothetical protein
MIDVAFSDILDIEVAFSEESGIEVAFSNINYREEMKYLQTFSISEGETKVLTTPIATEPYNLEFIDSDGHVITSGMGEPILELVGGIYKVTVYSAIAITDVKLKILY